MAFLVFDSAYLFAVADFNMREDSLCFFNKRFTYGPPILKRIANNRGGCQGIAFVAKALKENVEYICDTDKKDPEGIINQKINRALHLSKNACNGKIQIFGYCNTKQLCHDFQPELEAHALTFNYSIFNEKVWPIYTSSNSMTIGDYFSNTKNRHDLLNREDIQQNNAIVLRKIFAMLKNNNMPLLLYPHHVVLVTSMTYELSGTGSYNVKLKVYDSDFSVEKALEYSVASDWGRTIREMPIYIVSPHDQIELRECRR